jgi:hypothetical protein
MLPLDLVLDLARAWAESQAVEKLKAYAADPRPDIQFDMPIVGEKVDVWVRDVNKPPPTAPKARRALKVTVGDGEVFYLYYLVSRRR